MLPEDKQAKDSIPSLYHSARGWRRVSSGVTRRPHLRVRVSPSTPNVTPNFSKNWTSKWVKHMSRGSGTVGKEKKWRSHGGMLYRPYIGNNFNIMETQRQKAQIWRQKLKEGAYAAWQLKVVQYGHDYPWCIYLLPLVKQSMQGFASLQKTLKYN